MKKVFVIMPFDEEFDDVYHIIRDSGNQASKESGVDLSVFRADEISEPGRISVQVIDAIKDSDMIVADITGSNPNVMYELGYAHALEKTVVLLNQSVHKSPFDVKDFRQIVYQRTKLLRDCRPRLITAIKSVVSNHLDTSTEKTTGETTALEKSNENRLSVRRPGPKLVADLQECHIELQMYNKLGDAGELQKIGKKVRDLIDTVTIVGRVDASDARNSASAMGNCAVELEKGEEYQLAEELFNRALGLFPDHEGLHIQYADFLFDQGHEDEARDELRKAKSINPDDPRIARLEMKFAAQGEEVSEEIGDMLKRVFESDPSNNHKAAAYLMYLSKIEGSEDQFEQACLLWESNLSENEKIVPRRALADFYANRNPSKAIELYEQIINAESISEDNLHDALHNLATLYAIDDKRDEAMRYWKWAYSIDRNDETVKAAFSQRLASWDMFDLAKKVIKGEPLED